MLAKFREISRKNVTNVKYIIVSQRGRKYLSEEIHFLSAHCCWRSQTSVCWKGRRPDFISVKFTFLRSLLFSAMDRGAMSSREALNMKLPAIQSTAGAVPVRNEKG